VVAARDKEEGKSALSASSSPRPTLLPFLIPVRKKQKEKKRRRRAGDTPITQSFVDPLRPARRPPSPLDARHEKGKEKKKKGGKEKKKTQVRAKAGSRSLSGGVFRNSAEKGEKKRKKRKEEGEREVGGIQVFCDLPKRKPGEPRRDRRLASGGMSKGKGRKKKEGRSVRSVVLPPSF